MSLHIVKKNGGAYVNSREVAEVIGKSHRSLLRDIRGYAKILEKYTEHNFVPSDFFLESAYFDSTGRKLPCFLLSKRGCELCANKLIGEKGVMFTALYVQRFNEMETAEREAEIKSYAKPRLSEFNDAVKNVLHGMTYCFAKPSRVMGFLHGVYETLGIKVSSEYKRADYLSATDIAKTLHLYSETGRPHAHAVSAIIMKLDNWENHAIIIPYGLVGVAARYDRYIAEAVRDWIMDNNFPREIAHNNFYYHVYYALKNIIIDGEEFYIGGERPIDIND